MTKLIEVHVSDVISFIYRFRDYVYRFHRSSNGKFTPIDIKEAEKLLRWWSVIKGKGGGRLLASTVSIKSVTLSSDGDVLVSVFASNNNNRMVVSLCGNAVAAVYTDSRGDYRKLI